MSNKQPILALQGICKDYKQGRSTIEVLKDVNLEVYDNEMVAIIGPSGCGKSTLLHIAGLLDYPDRGKVSIRGVDDEMVKNLKKSSQLRLANIGFIYQYHHLLKDFTAQENVAIPLFISGITLANAMEQAETILRHIGLGKRLFNKPGELSGGEQQRVAIARALITHPAIILADEPTGNLDPSNAHEVFALLLHEAQVRGAAVIMVSHNIDLAAKMHRIYQL